MPLEDQKRESKAIEALFLRFRQNVVKKLPKNLMRDLSTLSINQLDEIRYLARNGSREELNQKSFGKSYVC